MPPFMGLLGKVLLVCLAIGVLVLIVARIVVRAIFYGNSARPRVKVPWRFSLLAIVVLATLLAPVLGVFREEPTSAVVAAIVVTGLWLPVASFLEFRRALTDRRNKELAATIKVVRMQHEQRDDASS